MNSWEASNKTIAIAYAPVVHRGHLQFCQKVQPDILGILGRSLLAEIPILERDVRAVSPEDAVRMCRALNLALEVIIVEREDVARLASAKKIVFAADDATRYVTGHYLSQIPFEFEDIFLRWDKMASITKLPVSPDQVISREVFDQYCMGHARTESQKSSDWWRQVGAVLVKDGEIILSGFNHHQPTDHSLYIDGDPRGNFDAGDPALKDIGLALHGEAGIIAQAAKRGVSLEGTSLYVTTFPCPTCAFSVIGAGIKKVFYADGYSSLNAQEIFKNAGVVVVRVLSV